MPVSTSMDLGVLAQVCKALANPVRRRIVAALLDGPGYPAEMADDLGTSRAVLSNHLACLRGCGIVRATAEGRRVRYELFDPKLGEALALLARLDLPPCSCDPSGVSCDVEEV